MTNVKYIRARIFVIIAIVTGGISIAFVGLYIFQAHLNKTSINTNAPISKPSSSPVGSISHVYSLPTRLLIPKLSVDASIISMGITATGTMDSPKTNQDTGWYSLGVRPGNVGSAVIAGHLGLKQEAIFGKLHLLVAGDTLSVIDDQGTTVSFVVREVREYERDSDTTEIFNSKDGAHLNLITCNGDWESSQATYDKRLVVFSDKI